MRSNRQGLLLLTIAALGMVSCGGGTTSSSAASSSSASSSGAASSSSSASTKQEVSITDANGRTVTVKPGGYTKPLCIGAGALRLYSYLGDCSILSGVEDIDNVDAQGRPKMFDGVARPYFIAHENDFKGKPSCGKGGPQAQEAEAEKILDCNNDIVFSEYEDVEKANALQEQIGVPVITLKYGKDGVFDNAVKTSLNLIGQILDKAEKATTLINYIDACKQEISDKTKDLDHSKKVYICGLGNWGTTNQYMTAKDYAPFNVAHITNVVDDVLTVSGVTQIEKETLFGIYDQIDVMVVDAAAIKNMKPLYQEDPTIFDGCKAVTNGEVYLQMAYNAYYTNLETALINTYWNAKCVYPDAFKDLDIDAKTNEVTKAFLGVELATQIKEYPQSFGGYQKVDLKALLSA